MIRSVMMLAFAALALALAADSGAQAASTPLDSAQAQLSADHVEGHDDTRVEVQLVVLGVAAFVVVGVGTAAYLLRKRLGLVAPPPEQDAGGHH